MSTTPTNGKFIRRVVCEQGPDPVDVAVGARIRALRVARGMSQQKLAAAIGYTFQQLQKYETGRNRVAASVMVRIARALGCSPASFFTEIEAPALCIASDLALLPDASREAIGRVVKAILATDAEAAR